MYLAVKYESDPSVVFGSVRDALWRLAQATCTTYRHVKTLSCPNATNGWGLGYDQYPAAFKPTEIYHHNGIPFTWHQLGSIGPSSSLPDRQIKKFGNR